MNGVSKSPEHSEPLPTAAHPVPQETTKEPGKEVHENSAPEQGATKEVETTQGLNVNSAPEETVLKNSSPEIQLQRVSSGSAVVDQPNGDPATEPGTEPVRIVAETRIAPSKFHVAVATPTHTREPTKQKKPTEIRVGGFFAGRQYSRSVETTVHLFAHPARVAN